MLMSNTEGRIRELALLGDGIFRSLAASKRSDGQDARGLQVPSSECAGEEATRDLRLHGNFHLLPPGEFLGFLIAGV